MRISDLYVGSLRSVFFKIDRSTQKLTTGRIPYFDIRYSLFDIRFFRVSFSIKLAVFQASGGAYTLNLLPYTPSFPATNILIPTLCAMPYALCSHPSTFNFPHSQFRLPVSPFRIPTSAF
jgi:hypothetical protein